MSNRLHTGYGSEFTTITVKDEILTKQALGEYGDFKTKHESGFYNYIAKKGYTWKLPTIHLSTPGCIKMRYYKDHLPLYSIYGKLSLPRKKTILTRVLNILNELHSFETVTLNKVEFTNHIKLETHDKLATRHSSIAHILKTCENVTHANSIKLFSFGELLYKIQDFIDNYICGLKNYSFAIIHGDCQFSNILYNESTDDIIFIDPRGYFGNSQIYGLKEYDIAKVQFALSGYDYFDKLEVNDLVIENNNLIIDNFSINLDFIKNIDIISVLVISIWLGNAHAFTNHPKKVILSHYYARYLGTLLFRKSRDGII